MGGLPACGKVATLMIRCLGWLLGCCYVVAKLFTHSLSFIVLAQKVSEKSSVATFKGCLIIVKINEMYEAISAK